MVNIFRARLKHLNHRSPYLIQPRTSYFGRMTALTTFWVCYSSSHTTIREHYVTTPHPLLLPLPCSLTYQPWIAIKSTTSLMWGTLRLLSVLLAICWSINLLEGSVFWTLCLYLFLLQNSTALSCSNNYLNE